MSLAPYMINLFKNHIGRYSKQLAVKPKIKKNVKVFKSFKDILSSLTQIANIFMNLYLR